MRFEAQEGGLSACWCEDGVGGWARRGRGSGSWERTPWQPAELLGPQSSPCHPLSPTTSNNQLGSGFSIRSAWMGTLSA